MEEQYVEGGFIKLYRSLLKWEWYDDRNVKVLFLHLLLKANYENKKWHGNEIQRGQLITSTNKLAKETGLTIQQVKTCIAKLKKTGEITIKPTSKYTLINIEKYDFFQRYDSESNQQNNNQITIKQTADNQQITNEQTADNQQVTTTKEIKEIKEVKENKEIKEGKENIYQLIADMYNDTCVSLPHCTKLSEAREKAIHARLKKYSIEEFKLVFEKAEDSNFLKGANSKNWSANFDWLISDKNMAKVLEDYYADKTPKINERENKLNSFAFPTGLRAKVEEWLHYKTEQGKPYHDTALKNFLEQVQKEYTCHGEQAVINIIQASMASNYDGVVWQKIAEKNGQSNFSTPKQNRFVNYEQRKWDFSSIEQMERERLQQQHSQR